MLTVTGQDCERSENGPGSQVVWIQVLVLPLPSCMTSGKVLDFSGLSFLIFKLGAMVLYLLSWLLS